MRSRKQKPAAPNPPGHPSKDDNKGDKVGNRESRDMTTCQEKSKDKPHRDKADEKNDKKVDKQSKEKETTRVDKATSPRQIVKNVNSSPTSKEPIKNEKTPSKEDSKTIENKTETTEICKELDKIENLDSSNTKFTENEGRKFEMNMDFAQYNARRGSSGDLNRRTSKSGEDVRKMKVDEGGFCTLRKPPRPMPRTVIGEGVEKPAIPERPPQLQRPLSFRLPKSPESLDVSLVFYYPNINPK